MERIIDTDIVLRTDDKGNEYIEGYGVIFNKPSQILRTESGQRFIEIISPDAVKNTDLTRTLGLFHHKKDQILGRVSSGTMEISNDGKGLYYRIKKPNTSLGNDIKEQILRKDITGSSFSFPADSKAELRKGEDGVYVRTVTSIDNISDMGPTPTPAYLQTTAAVSMRSVDEFAEKEKQEIGLSITDQIKLHRAKLW